jgi:hypothetical protein
VGLVFPPAKPLRQKSEPQLEACGPAPSRVRLCLFDSLSCEPTGFAEKGLRNGGLMPHLLEIFLDAREAGIEDLLDS